MASANPFTDVEPDVWYTDAAIWAAEQGLVPGSGTLGAKDGCTREAVVTFLFPCLHRPSFCRCLDSPREICLRCFHCDKILSSNADTWHRPGADEPPDDRLV